MNEDLNSWNKFLETVLDENSLSSPDNVRVLASFFGKKSNPDIQIWLLRYECTICMQSILELRMGQCTHEYCSACVPRPNCRIGCRLTILNRISAGDSKAAQEKIIKDFKASGTFIDISPRSYKRKACDEDDDDDDEMSE